MFINACFAGTGQREFYADAAGQRVSMDFLHDYILGNYRLLYARSLAAGINHASRATAVVRLLATGRETAPEHRAEEGALIAAGRCARSRCTAPTTRSRPWRGVASTTGGRGPSSASTWRAGATPSSRR